MSILELLLALVVICILTVGMGKITLPQIILGIILLGLVFVGVHYLIRWFTDRFLLGIDVSRREKNKLASRRHLFKFLTTRTRKEENLDALDEPALRKHIEDHPQDSLAVEILSERLLREKRLAEYAREMEYLLNLKSDMTREEKCSRYHALAALYLNELGRPDRAREMLRTIIANYPKHYQATLARQRLAMISEDSAAAAEPADQNNFGV